MLDQTILDLKNDLERISKLGPFQQTREIWPVVWKLWSALAEIAAELNALKTEGGSKNAS